MFSTEKPKNLNHQQPVLMISPREHILLAFFFKSVAKFVHCCKVRSMEEDEREMRLFLLHVRSVPPSDGHLCQKLLSAASFHFSFKKVVRLIVC